ncbi:LOW QUALITY PROTEIN: Condensin complex subunit 3 [Gryllus bimaculatus]|nr:LOW QUALITY PROTEIN: Condensin complex subunit 3 [Gryllus bimaculatus]
MKSLNKYSLPTILERLKNPPVEIFLDKKEDIIRINENDQETLWNCLLTNVETVINTALYPDRGSQNGKQSEKNNSEKHVKEVCDKQDEDFAQEFLFTLIQLAHTVIDVPEPTVPDSMTSLVTVKSHIVKLCSLWLKKKLQLEESMLVDTFKYVVKQSLLDGALKADVLSVWTFRAAVKIVIESKDYFKVMKDDLLDVPVSKNFLKCKEGCNFVGFMMTLNVQFTLEIHDVIKKYLPVYKAEEYAPIYYYAWNSSNFEMKTVIEKECIQFFMLKSLTLPRQNLNMIIAGQNALRILSQFHQQKHFPHVQKMLSTLYEPLLWRYLTSPNNTHRCNATEVLFDAYPLERPGKGRQINDVYLNQQHDAITKLLTDNCHIVRIIAIRQVCKVLSSYWEAIPAETIHRWMKTICILANDFSSFFVRRSVFKGLPVLLTNPHATLCLEQILPRFQKNFHDPNEQVRSAFVNMLLAVKAAKGRLKFWHIVPLEELVGRLEVENEVVGIKLVDLLFESFFNSQFDEATVILRLVHLVALNSSASLKFFYFSKKRLPLQQAVKMMLDIITFVRGYVKAKLDAAKVSGKKDQQAQQSPVSKKRKLFSEQDNLTSVNESIDDIVTETVMTDGSSIATTSTFSLLENTEEPPKEMPLDNPEISKGFLEIAGVLWHIHLKDIEKPENKEIRNNIFDVFEPCLNSFLQFFKSHTGLYSAVLGLCSFMPPSRLKYVSTVESSCVSQLKKMQWDNNSDKMLMFLVPLCMWGRGADVIELAREWLKETFKKANVANGRRSSSCRRKVVNFKEATGPKPRLGLRLIDSILMIPRCKNKVFGQHSEELVQLWLYMGTVKELIDNRLGRGECFQDPDLCDTFLEECFDLYLTLMISLDNVIHEDQPLNSVHEFKVIVEWASETLLPHIPLDLGDVSDEHCDEESPPMLPFVVNILNIVIKYATCLMPLGRVDLQLVRSLAILIKCSLSKDYIKGYDKGDQLHLFRRVVLTLMKMVLDALSEHHMEQTSMKKYVQDFSKVKCTMNEVLMFSQRHSAKLAQNVASMFVVSVVNIIRTAMRVEAFEEPVGKINCLPFLAAQIVSLFVLRVPMAKLFCSGLEKHFATYTKKDATYFIAALNLYYVLCHSSTKIPPESLHNILSSCRDCYKAELIRQKSEEGSSEIIETLLSKKRNGFFLRKFCVNVIDKLRLLCVDALVAKIMTVTVENIFDKAQLSTLSHNKLLQRLVDLHEKSNPLEFQKRFVLCLKYAIANGEKGPAVRILDLVSKFCGKLEGRKTLNGKVDKQNDDNDDKKDDDEEEENEDEEPMNPFVSDLLKELLKVHGCKSSSSRMRICYCIKRILQCLGPEASIDSDICEEIYAAMLERLKDKSPSVRAQAVTALERLQDPSDPDCPVVKAFLFHMSMDPSAEVRRAVLLCLGRSKYSLPYIRNRIQDVKDSVRKQAYVSLSKVTIRSHSIKNRELILSQGLKDRNDSVRDSVEKVLLPNWFENCQGNFVDFLHSLDVENSEIAEKAIKVIFRQQSKEKLIKNLDLDSEKLIPSEKLTIELSFVWRCLAEFLQSEEDGQWELILPELSLFCEYVKRNLDRLKEINKLEKLEPWDHTPNDFIILQLLQLMKVFDLGDEAGREKLKQLLIDMLMSSDTRLKLIPTIIDVLVKVVPDVAARLQLIAETISEIHDPLVEDVEDIPADQKRELDYKLAQLRLQRNILEEDLEKAVEEKRYLAAEDLKNDLAKITEELQLLSVSSGSKESLVKHQKDDPGIISKCLTIVFEMMQSPTVKELNPQLRSLLDNFVKNSLKIEHAVVQVIALQCLAVFSLLDESIAKEVIVIFCLYLGSTCDEIAQVAVKGIFDLLLRYGLKTFAIREEDGDILDVTATPRKKLKKNLMRKSTLIIEESDDNESEAETVSNKNDSKEIETKEYHLLALLTKHLDSAVNIHNNLALQVCNEALIENYGPNQHEWINLLCLMELVLDDDLRKNLQKMADKIKRDCPDKASIRAIQKFQNILKGKPDRRHRGSESTTGEVTASENMDLTQTDSRLSAKRGSSFLGSDGGSTGSEASFNRNKALRTGSSSMIPSSSEFMGVIPETSESDSDSVFENEEE